MEEERIDDELLDLDDVLAPEEASSDTGQLYEHFRVEVDKGQEPERIDKMPIVIARNKSCLLLEAHFFHNFLMLHIFPPFLYSTALENPRHLHFLNQNHFTPARGIII